MRSRSPGPGDALLVQPVEEAGLQLGVRHRGPSAVALGVMEDNPRGRHAYLRLGYNLTEAREHIRDGRDELFMTKTLPSPSPI